MHRTIKLVLAMLLVAAWPAVAPAPAQANGFAICFATYTITTASRVYHSVLGPSVHTTYTMSSSSGSGVCTNGMLPPDITGNISGSCQLASGTANSWGHTASATWVGGEILMQGGTMHGSLIFAPDATAGHSCLEGATGFIAMGVVYYV